MCCCVLPVCCYVLLCATVCCSHHCLRAVVITVFIPTRASSAHKRLSKYTYTRARANPYPCVCLRHTPVCLHHTVCYTEKERSRPARCFGKHWKCGERDTEGVCGALSVLEVYTYIYIYIYIYKYMYIQREKERYVEESGVVH